MPSHKHKRHRFGGAQVATGLRRHGAGLDYAILSIGGISIEPHIDPAKALRNPPVLGGFGVSLYSFSSRCLTLPSQITLADNKGYK